MIVEIRNETFVKNLTYLRKKYFLSCRALGHLIGVSPLLVEYIEKGKRKADLPTFAILRICTVFDVTAKELLDEDLSLIPASFPDPIY